MKLFTNIIFTIGCSSACCVLVIVIVLNAVGILDLGRGQETDKNICLHGAYILVVGD